MHQGNVPSSQKRSWCRHEVCNDQLSYRQQASPQRMRAGGERANGPHEPCPGGGESSRGRLWTSRLCSITETLDGCWQGRFTTDVGNVEGLRQRKMRLLELSSSSSDGRCACPCLMCASCTRSCSEKLQRCGCWQGEQQEGALCVLTRGCYGCIRTLFFHSTSSWCPSSRPCTDT